MLKKNGRKAAATKYRSKESSGYFALLVLVAVVVFRGF